VVVAVDFGLDKAAGMNVEMKGEILNGYNLIEVGKVVVDKQTAARYNLEEGADHSVGDVAYENFHDMTHHRSQNWMMMVQIVSIFHYYQEGEN
jgi:hypothetical protein